MKSETVKFFFRPNYDTSNYKMTCPSLYNALKSPTVWAPLYNIVYVCIIECDQEMNRELSPD